MKGYEMKAQRWINILLVLALLTMAVNMAISTRATGFLVTETEWNEFVNAHNTGWIPSAALVYVSASSFKITGVDVTATYIKGTKIKLTQTTDKYFYVTGSSFSTDTTVTVTAGSDYTVANAAITSPYYSYASNPQGFPTWFSYTPTITGFSVDPTTVKARFIIYGNSCTVNINISNGGTSNATTMTVTAPVVGVVTNTSWTNSLGATFDNGAYVAAGGVWLDSADNILHLYTSGPGTWTASGTKFAHFQITYEY
jgi:hypothetical protein